MEFEKVRDIIAETLGCDAEAVTPPLLWLTIWVPILWLPWSWSWPWKRPSASPSPRRTPLT